MLKYRIRNGPRPPVDRSRRQSPRRRPFEIGPPCTSLGAPTVSWVTGDRRWGMGPVAHLTGWFGLGQRDPKMPNRVDVGNVAGVPQVGPLIPGWPGGLLPTPPTT